MKRSVGQKFQPVNEINMTPFIDVMLVLLIIFMITAPLLTVGVEVDLPKTQAGSMNEQVEPLVISIDKKQRIYIQETSTDMKSLTSRLNAITRNNHNTTLYIQADQNIPYRIVMDVMGRLNRAGFKKVGLIGESSTPTQRTSPRK